MTAEKGQVKGGSTISIREGAWTCREVSAGENSIACRRLAAAIVIVAAIVLAVPLSDAVLKAVDAQTAVNSAPMGLNARALLQGGSAEDVVARLEKAAAQAGTEQDAPVWFQEDIGFLPEARDVRVDSEDAVVGYVVPGDCESVLDVLSAHMEKRGWSCVPLGQVCGATFVREQGPCLWTLVTCTQVSSATSVVFRCQARTR